MPRITRNIVEFTVADVKYRAVFEHQHCSEHPTETVVLPVYEEVAIGGGVLGSQITEKIWVRDDVDGKVLKPIVEDVEVEGQLIRRRLRHITTCRLQKADSGHDAAAGWMVIGTGVARCSVKDRYYWQKGIKAALKAAIADAKLPEGAFLSAYYSELRVMPEVEIAPGVFVKVSK